MIYYLIKVSNRIKNFINVRIINIFNKKILCYLKFHNKK